MDNNRVLTLKERYLSLKEEHGNNKELMMFVDHIEEVSNNPKPKDYKELETHMNNVQGELDTLEDDERELVERLYHQALFAAKKEREADLSKWDFFKETAKEKDWGPVIDMIYLISNNDDRYEKIRTGSNEVDQKKINEQYEKDKEELEHFEKKLEEEIIPWADKNVSDYYKDLIIRTLSGRIRVIHNRLKRNTDLAFGNWLKKARKTQGMTLQDVADKSDTSASYIQRLEKGKRKVPSLPIVQSIAEALNEPYKEVLNIINGNEDEDRPIETVLMNEEFTLLNKRATKKQKKMIINLIKASLNVENKDPYDNMMEIQNIAREIKRDIDIENEQNLADFSNE